MTYCTSNTLVKQEGKDAVAVSLRCRSWLCPDCYPQRKARLIANAIGGKPNTFVTLTVRRDQYATPELAAAALARAWRIVRLRAIREARRDTGRRAKPSGPAPEGGWTRNGQGFTPRKVVLTNGKLPFLAVVELHRSGWPHFHLLLRSKWIDHKWLSLQMQELLNSPVVGINRITEKGRAAAYCAKYCGKCARKVGNTKRYWQSQDYSSFSTDQLDPLPDIPAPWEKRQVNVWNLCAEFERRGFQVRWLDQWRFMAECRGPP